MLPASIKIYSEKDQIEIEKLDEGFASLSGAGWSEISKSSGELVKKEKAEHVTVFKIKTMDGNTIVCTPEHTLFARMDYGMKFFSVFLHERSSMGFRLGVSYDLIGALSSPSAFKGEIPAKEDREIIDRFWIIENTGNIAEANYIHKMAVYRYGIPDIPFVSRLTDTINIGPDFTKMVFNNVDTPGRAADLLKDSCMFEEHPHIKMRLSGHEPPISNSIQLTIFGAEEKAKEGTFSNLIQISGVKDGSIRTDGDTVYKRPGRHGSWQLSITRDDLEEAELFVKTLSYLDSLEVVKRIQLTKKSPYYIMPASHIKRGMMVPIMGQGGVIAEDIVESVSVEEYEGELYELSIPKFKNIIANGWFIGA